ncbi:MAG: SCO6745 family protein [Acidimicrobiales bacterium]
MLARDLWVRIETIHAVTYFAPEAAQAAKDAGLRGFWMSYFGFRASPLGPVGPGVVEATFANFSPAMVRRAIPDAWSYAHPPELVRVRAAAASAALRDVLPSIEGAAEALNPVLQRVAAAADPLGRPLFAANLGVSQFDDPVAQLWQLCTTLREHRGDGHVAALAAAGVGGCQAHLLLIADRGLPAEVFLDNRGWDEPSRLEAHHGLQERGLIDGPVLTEAGRELRARIEATTDERANEPYSTALSEPDLAGLMESLTPLAAAVQTADVIPFPNPMGLPPI